MVTDVPSTEAARRTVEAVWRMEAPRLIAGLGRVTGDLGEAEELAQEAFVVALEQWPTTGIPPNPVGWLMTTAKNRAIDGYRKQAVAQRKLEMMGREAKASELGQQVLHPADLSGLGGRNVSRHLADDHVDAVLRRINGHVDRPRVVADHALDEQPVEPWHLSAARTGERCRKAG